MDWVLSNYIYVTFNSYTRHPFVPSVLRRSCSCWTEVWSVRRRKRTVCWWPDDSELWHFLSVQAELTTCITITEIACGAVSYSLSHTAHIHTWELMMVWMTQTRYNSDHTLFSIKHTTLLYSVSVCLFWCTRFLVSKQSCFSNSGLIAFHFSPEGNKHSNMVSMFVISTGLKWHAFPGNATEHVLSTCEPFSTSWPHMLSLQANTI